MYLSVTYGVDAGAVCKPSGRAEGWNCLNPMLRKELRIKLLYCINGTVEGGDVLILFSMQMN